VSGGGQQMVGAVASVWAAPGFDESGPSGDDDRGRTGNGHPGPATVMVVEDEVLIRLSLSEYLRDCGYRVVEAASGEEAQSVFQAGVPIEVLFSDVDLGRDIMTGLALAAWVRRGYPHVRILLGSGIARLPAEVAHLCDGPPLQKPYSYPELAARIRALIESFGSRRA
jgi:DNA-binding response OmpR family regulator